MEQHMEKINASKRQVLEQNNKEKAECIKTVDTTAETIIQKVREWQECQ